jgi:hypothetical protein
MRYALIGAVVLAVMFAVPQRATAQTLNVDDLLDLINGGTGGIDIPGGGTGSDGGGGTSDPGTGGGTDDGMDEEVLIPQQNIKPGAMRERAPGRRVGQGIVNYRDRRANIRLVGPQTGIVSPDIPEQQTAMQALIIDVSETFFGFITQITTGFNLLTQFNNPNIGSGTDISQLLQQLTGQSSREIDGSDIIVPKVVGEERSRTPSVVVPPAVSPTTPQNQ